MAASCGTGLTAAAKGVNAPALSHSRSILPCRQIRMTATKFGFRGKRVMDLAVRQLHPLFAAEVRGADLSRDIEPATIDHRLSVPPGIFLSAKSTDAKLRRRRRRRTAPPWRSGRPRAPEHCPDPAPRST